MLYNTLCSIHLDMFIFKLFNWQYEHFSNVCFLDEIFKQSPYPINDVFQQRLGSFV